jgi:hypothetical protein
VVPLAAEATLHFFCRMCSLSAAVSIRVAYLVQRGSNIIMHCMCGGAQWVGIVHIYAVFQVHVFKKKNKMADCNVTLQHS